MWCVLTLACQLWSGVRFPSGAERWSKPRILMVKASHIDGQSLEIIPKPQTPNPTPGRRGAKRGGGGNGPIRRKSNRESALLDSTGL